MNDDGLRIGDTEREQAARAIGEHFAQGRLTNDEYDERLERVWKAKTFGELRPMFSDLPGPRPAFLERPAPGPFPFAGPPRPAYPPARHGTHLPVPPPGPPIPRQSQRSWWPMLILGILAIGLIDELEFFGVILVAVVAWILLSRRSNRGNRKGPHSGHFPGHGPSY